MEKRVEERMEEESEKQMKAQIEKKWEQVAEQYPRLKAEMDAFANTISAAEALWLKAEYALSSVHDCISYSPKELYAYVRASKRMREELSYAKQVPDSYFYRYVLPARINNENLDGSRMWLYESLKDRVQQKSMREAALEVNLWCYEKATYTLADDRTIAPFGMCRRAKGRCGEESVLLVSALRAVGIPARQCYAPRWAHCDDNHAWVEVWADGDWHYMGACEPEPVLDKGWFSAAASKALLIRSREPDFSDQPTGYRLINSTSRYGRTRRLQVQVLAEGKPLQGAWVQFQLVNYSELYPLYEIESDAEGRASMEFGLGDLYVSALYNGLWLGKKVDLRECDRVELELGQGRDLESVSGEYEECFDLIPPLEEVQIEEKTAPKEVQAAFAKRLRECERIRAAYEATFIKEGEAWFVASCGNHEEIEAFLAGETSQAGEVQEDKKWLLQTLREKDYVDTDAKTLQSYLEAALCWKEAYPREIWKEGILAPRVENEMLRFGLRQELRALLEQEGIGKAKQGEMEKLKAEELFDWMEASLQKVPEFGLENRQVDYVGCLRHKICPQSKWDALLVQLCRSVGIAARRNPVTARAQSWNRGLGIWEDVLLSKEVQKEEAKLLLSCPEEALRYGEQITIACLGERGYETLDFSGVRFQGEVSLPLACGSYRILTTRRQIDGSVSVWMQQFVLRGERRVALRLCEDRMRQKIKSETLPKIEGIDPTEAKKAQLFLYVEVGKEPTEHLLCELLDLKEEWNQRAYPIWIFVSSQEEEKNDTLQRVKRELHTSHICRVQGTEDRVKLLECMGVGDERLPFSLAVGEDGKGKFAFANYNIKTAHTLLRILNANG
ncbi:MAG: transglutaminase-like domain-containing protein [bacterium]|nr:transglutaminase-like domain-containing protein [bacterium]